MKKIIFVLAIIGITTLTVQAQKKVPKSESGSVINDMKKALLKKYKYQSMDVFMLAGKLNIDIADIHVKYMPKNIREEKSKEIADFARTFLDKTPAGKKLLNEISGITINHLNKAGGGALTAPFNTYEKYFF